MTVFVSIDPGKAKQIGAIAARLSSNHDGEVVAASRALGRALAKHDLGIGEVFERGLRPQELPRPAASAVWPSGPPPVTPLREHQRWARECLAWKHLLNDWERGFVADMAAARRVSQKQSDKLAVITAKVRRLRPQAEDF